MNTSVERINAHTVKLTITVPAADVDTAIEAAYKNIARKVKIPGFRAGRAPKPIIDSHVGREAVFAEAQDELLNSAYSKALDGESLRPIARPSVDEPGLIERGKDFEFTAQVEVRPELTLSSIEGLSATVPSAITSEAEINAQIEHARNQLATLEPVEERGLAADDYALISFVGTVDGEEYEGNTVDGYLYEMGRGLMPSQFDEGLIGAMPGEERVVAFTVPDTSSNPEFVGKTVSFVVNVKEIKAKVLPEVNEEFAANAGGYGSVEEMRSALRQTMDNAKQVGRGRAIERGVRQALAERLVGEAPEAMIKTTQGQMMRDFLNGLESRGLSLPDYLNATGATMEMLEAQTAEQARTVVTEELALEALFRHLGLEITEADIDEEISIISSSSAASDPAELRRSWEESGVIEALREQVIHKKAMEWLVDSKNVAIIEVDAASDDDAGADVDAGADADADADAKDKG